MKTIRTLCLVMCVLFVVSMVSLGASAKDDHILEPTGEAAVYYIETYDQLKAHAFNAQSNYRYILNDDIIQDDNTNNMEIVIPAGATFNLDLNGYTISRSTQGNDCALFRIKSDGRMVITDTSASNTGSCSFSEGYADYYKAVFFNEGGELEILGGYYEIFSPFEQGDCSILRTTSGYTNIYDGTFDSSSAFGGDTISVGHNAYVYDVPQVYVFGGEFYGKYSNIDVTPFSNYLEFKCLYPSVYVLGGNFYVTKADNSTGFAYCNNGWGRVIVAEGTVMYKCLNSDDQRFLQGVSKKLFTQTIDDYEESYYMVTAPPMIVANGLDYYYRLIGLCDKEVVNSYGNSVYELHKDKFDAILERIDTIHVSETDKVSPEIKLVNRTADHQYVNWYMVDESDYCGEETNWTYLGDFQNISQWQLSERPDENVSYLIRCVVTDKNLATYEDIVRISYTPLKKAETIESVKITGVETPEQGKTPDFDLIAEDAFYINGVFWKDLTTNSYLKETDTFTSGHQYELQVWIRANEYYQFGLDNDDCLDITATVEDKEAEVALPGTSISAELSVIFEVSVENVTTDSTEPADTTPSSSTTPTDSSDPTEPEKPSDSSDPTEPEKPSDSSDPTEPSTCETTPSTPENPTDTKPTLPGADKGILGDVNGDGKVNIKDATTIQKFAAKILDLTDAEKLRADVNIDTKINIKDATAIQKYVAKIETGYPIGQQIA
ncbi:MAG: hypothetical protein E7532_05365 [Ruminococcaceae bacterium]|nr:hypothetical protein [Oscillospiraceae bacterium]